MFAKHPFIWTLAFCLLAAAPAALRAQQPPPSEGDEARQIEILKSDAPLFDKAKACQMLAVIGTGDCIPVLAELLADPQLGHYARFGLEPNPDPAVDDGFRLSVAAVGDMMIGTDYPRDRLPDDDARGFFDGVAGLLVAADLALGNLEGVLSDSGVPAKSCSNPDACYLFRSPTRYASHFRDAGFDALSLANNHALDFGEAGRSETMAALSAVGIRHSGREGDFASLSVKGKRVAMLAFAVTRNSNLVHDYPLAERIVRDFAATHDIVIVSFHGGAEGGKALHVPDGPEEFYGEDRGDLRAFTRLVVDAGADLVLGHGPHVLRGMEIYQDRLIAYSLGNFATYGRFSLGGHLGVGAVLEVELDPEGRFVGGKLLPTVQIGKGIPRRDPDGKAIDLVRRLSQQDFGASGVVVAQDGTIGRR